MDVRESAALFTKMRSLYVQISQPWRALEMACKNCTPCLRFVQAAAVLGAFQKMKSLADPVNEKVKHFSGRLRAKLAWFHQWLCGWLSFTLHVLLFQVNPFWVKLGYYLVLSTLGFLVLKASKPRTAPQYIPTDVDLFFTSVSTVTVSSLSTVDMEVFSNTQLVFLTIMMLAGGEVFTSMLALYLKASKMKQGRTLPKYKIQTQSTEFNSSSLSADSIVDIELGKVTSFGEDKADTKPVDAENEGLKFRSIRGLAYLISCYLLVVHVAAFTVISLYFILNPNARNALARKGLRLEIFSIFTTVSNFAGCGFLPTNENMMVFKKNSFLLLLIIPQLLMGSTLYPACLRLAISFLEKVTEKPEFGYMLQNSREVGYRYLLSGVHSVYLAITGLGFIVVQLIVFCSLEWNSEATGDLSAYEKLVASLFQVVNSRHAGEAVFDLSTLSPAILVLFVMMMYLPSYTTFLPTEETEKISTSEEEEKKRKKEKNFWGHLMFSQLTYLALVIVLICIIEREKMARDPLNFNALSIVFEVISAYGNVGFSVGYSCARQLNPDGQCKDACYGFVGRWSNGGKFAIIAVMFFGRVKKFSVRGGSAWWILS